MWEIIDYSPEYFDKMIDMTIEYYGKDNDIANGEFIQHEYFSNDSGDAVIKLAYDFDNDVLAGQYIVIPTKIKVGAESVVTTLSLNTLTRDQYRGQGVFTALADAVYETCIQRGYGFCYGAPNPNSHPGFIKKLQFRDIGVIPLFLKIINPSQLVREKMKSNVLSFFAKPFGLFFKPCIDKNQDITIEEIVNDNVICFDDLWNKLKDKYSVLGIRDSKYIKWRYLEIPIRDYKIFIARQESIVLGYVICRITDVAGMRCGMIVDFMFENKNEAVGKKLLCSAEEYFDKEKVGLMGCLMQSHFEEAKIIKKAGFFKCPKFMEPQPFPIIYRRFNSFNGEHCMSDFDNWFFTMGDYDVI